MTKNRLFACLLASVMACGLTACGGEETSESSSEAATEATTEVATEAEESSEAAEESSKPGQLVSIGDVEENIGAESGYAYLSMTDSQWWLQYTGSNTDILSYGAGVAEITGNGDYTVSVSVDTNGARYDATGSVDGDLVANGTAFMAVQIMDGADVCPNAVITINSIIVDGTELPLTKKNFTNTEETEINGEKHNNIRSNIYNQWVPDDSLPGDARSAEGNIAELANAADYSATIFDAAALTTWKTIEVNFTVSGM